MLESEIYLTPNSNNVTVEGSVNGKFLATPLLRINYDKEILAYYEGAEFPQKGVSSLEVMRNVNIVKAIFISIFKVRFSLISIIEAFNYIGCRVLEQYFLKDQHRTAGGKELDSILSNFIFSLTSNRIVADRFSKIFSHLIEYDNAYRLRFIDLGSETSKEKLLENPRNEIKRILELLTEREVLFGKDVSNKFRYVSIVLRFVLLIPKFKRAFKYAITRSNWENMVYDNIDRYWACLRTDYDFMGMSSLARKVLLERNGFSLPIQKEYETRRN